MKHIQIRSAQNQDLDAIWAILSPTIRGGETYALPRDMSREEALSYWTGADRETFVAEEGGNIVGTYYLRPNQLGGGRHVANCGYMTHINAEGRGVARLMCEHSIDLAKACGFQAMQFNLVVSTNERAMRLWERMGFMIVGRLLLAFQHPTNGFVDALVMYRAL